MFKKMMISGVFVFLLSLGTVWGTTLHVPSVYPTIQAAIDAAVNGDEVLVAPGIYLESISIDGKYLTLRSTDGPDRTTIWGGNKPATVVYVHSGWSNPATVIDGFEITSRYGPYYYAHYASGITCVECSMKVANCVVNRCDYHGIECYEAFVEITNSQILDNDGGSLTKGAGIYGNTVDFTILNCTIANNVNKDGGAGIYLSNAMYFSQIKNSVIWGNISQSTTSGDQIWLESMAFLLIESTDLQDGAADAYIELYSTLNPGLGMMDADPLFVDPAGNDYHLTFPSPCKDMGDNLTVTGLHDFEGDPRIADGTVDMGADEFFTHLYNTGDETPGGTVEVKLIGRPGTNPVFLWIGSGVMATPIPTQYGNWHLGLPILLTLGLGSIGSPEGVSVMPYTFDPSFPAIDIPMQSLVGMELTNLCVIAVE